MALVVKKPPMNARDIRDVGSISRWGRSPGGGHGNPLQDSCLEDPMDRGAWWATVHRATKNQTQLKCLSTHALSECDSWSCFSHLAGKMKMRQMEGRKQSQENHREVRTFWQYDARCDSASGPMALRGSIL